MSRPFISKSSLFYLRSYSLIKSTCSITLQFPLFKFCLVYLSFSQSRFVYLSFCVLGLSLFLRPILWNLISTCLVGGRCRQQVGVGFKFAWNKTSGQCYKAYYWVNLDIPKFKIHFCGQSYKAFTTVNYDSTVSRVSKPTSVTRVGNFLHFGQLLKLFATMNLPKSPTFLGNFSKGAKIIHFSNEIIFGQLL